MAYVRSLRAVMAVGIPPLPGTRVSRFASDGASASRRVAHPAPPRNPRRDPASSSGCTAARSSCAAPPRTPGSSLLSARRGRQGPLGGVSARAGSGYVDALRRRRTRIDGSSARRGRRSRRRRGWRLGGRTPRARARARARDRARVRGGTRRSVATRVASGSPAGVVLIFAVVRPGKTPRRDGRGVGGGGVVLGGFSSRREGLDGGGGASGVRGRDGRDGSSPPSVSSTRICGRARVGTRRPPVLVQCGGAGARERVPRVRRGGDGRGVVGRGAGGWTCRTCFRFSTQSRRGGAVGRGGVRGAGHGGMSPSRRGGGAVEASIVRGGRRRSSRACGDERRGA